MKNREKYKDELVEACKNDEFYAFYDHNIKPFYDTKPCHSTEENKAAILTILWLDEEYIEPEERPIKTRQSEFLKMFPKAKIKNNAIDICPLATDAKFGCKSAIASCKDCKKDYWLAEVE